MPCDPSEEPAEFADFLHRRTSQTLAGDAFAPSILPTSVYALPGEPSGPHQYGRWSNPGWSDLESALGQLESAHAIAFPSGSAAIAAVFSTLFCAPGTRSGAEGKQRILLPLDGYMGTRVTATRLLEPMGIGVDLRLTRDYAHAELSSYSMVLAESPANPSLDLADLRQIADRVHESGGKLVVDNTVCTPVGQQPLALGADVSVYSDSKQMNGHADLIFGHACTRDAALARSIGEWRRVTGSIPGPFETWMLHRGLETLEVRHSRSSATALDLARLLADRLGSDRVCYPGLPGHPQHELACRQMRGGGCLIGLTLDGVERAEAFIGQCRYIRASTSLGGIHTSAERRARWGDDVAPGFVRLSVGIEPADELCREILRALDAVNAPSP